MDKYYTNIISVPEKPTVEPVAHVCADKGLYDAACIPMRHQNFRPERDNKSESWQAVYEAIKALLVQGGIVGVVGPRGAGKTQMAASLVGYVTTVLNRTAVYKKAFDIFLRIREAITSTGDSERSAIEEFVKPYFLVVDSYEVRSNTPFENRTFDHIIDRRYDTMRPTLIISNDTIKNFSATIGSSTVDRMKETGGIIEAKWPSFRVSIAPLKLEEK